MLKDDKQLFVVKNDSILDLMEVHPVFFGSQSVLVQGIPDGTKILEKTVPGAYAGMLVTILPQ
jgi:hypothetical protein